MFNGIVVFALQAMHLVYKALEKYTIPSCLPPELLPPGNRKETTPVIKTVPVLPNVLGIEPKVCLL